MKPRLGFVGPHLGAHAGWVVTQSEILARLFAGEGYEVRATSSVRQPLLRVADTLWTLPTWRRKVDLVILSVFSGRAFAIADVTSRACAALGLRQIHVLRGGGFSELASSHPSWARRVLKRAHQVVAPSAFLARSATHLGFDAAVIPNVLDLGAYPFRLRERVAQPLELLWVRTFHPIYRPQVAVNVLASLIDRGVDAKLTLAGQDKGLESACKQHAADRGLADRVRFPGFLDAEAKRQEFAKHDVYLHTNRVDNTPVTVLEAAAFGLPIVATAVGGLPDLLENERTGLLVTDPGENGAELPRHLAQDLASAVLRLQQEPELIRRLSQEGRRLAEKSAWPSVHESWRHLFESE